MLSTDFLRHPTSHVRITDYIKRSGLALLISATVLLVTLARFCPITEIGHGTISGPEAYVYRAPYLLAQVKDPTGLLKTPNEDPNSTALRWRLFFPVVAHTLHLTPAIVLQLPRIGAGMLLAACILFLTRLTRDWRKTLGGAVLVATSWAFLVGAEWIAFDPLFLLLVVIFVFAESELVSVSVAAAALWSDERFLIFLLPLVFLRHSIVPLSRRAPLWIAGLVASYASIRIAAAWLGENSVTRQFSHQARLHYPVLPGWYFTFGVGWLLVLLAMAYVAKRLWSENTIPLAVIYVASLVSALGALAFLAGDTTRAIAICLPFLIRGIVLARTGVLWGLAALSLVLPTACYVYADCRFLCSCFSG